MKYDLSKNQMLTEFKQYCQHLIELKYNVELKKIRQKRSLNQNSYLHLLFNIFGIEFGLTLDESKQLIKKQFLSYTKKGNDFVRQTSSLNTKEMTDFIDKFRKLSSEHGFYLPEANEDLNYYENLIEQNQQYL